VPDSEAPEQGPEPPDPALFERGAAPERRAPAPTCSDRAPERKEGDRFRPEPGRELQLPTPERSDLDAELPVPASDAQAQGPEPRDPVPFEKESAPERRAPARVQSDRALERKGDDRFRPERGRELHRLARDGSELDGELHVSDSDAQGPRSDPRDPARFEKKLALEPTVLTIDQTNEAQRRRAGALDGTE
jgi:hypothetical protein